jgi:hypothetical protein
MIRPRGLVDGKYIEEDSIPESKLAFDVATQEELDEVAAVIQSYIDQNLSELSGSVDTVIMQLYNSVVKKDGAIDETVTGRKTFDNDTAFNSDVSIAGDTSTEALTVGGDLNLIGGSLVMAPAGVGNAGSAALGNTEVRGTLSVTSSAVVAGNLTVHGTTTFIHREETTIGDNEIDINVGETFEGITAGHAGISVSRGTLPPWKISVVGESTSATLRAGALGAGMTYSQLPEVVTSANVASYMSAGIGSAMGTAGGDISGTWGTTSVDKIKGKRIDYSVAPVDGAVLIYSAATDTFRTTSVSTSYGVTGLNAATLGGETKEQIKAFLSEGVTSNVIVMGKGVVSTGVDTFPGFGVNKDIVLSPALGTGIPYTVTVNPIADGIPQADIGDIYIDTSNGAYFTITNTGSFTGSFSYSVQTIGSEIPIGHNEDSSGLNVDMVDNMHVLDVTDPNNVSTPRDSIQEVWRNDVQGDVSGTLNNNIVTRIQGEHISEQDPMNGQFLTFSGSAGAGSWTPSSPSIRVLNSDNAVLIENAPLVANVPTTLVFPPTVDINVASANKLAVARTIGGVPFDGTANVNLTSSGISMAGYSKPASSSAITTSDTLSVAIGKLESGGSAVTAEVIAARGGLANLAARLAADRAAAGAAVTAEVIAARGGSTNLATRLATDRANAGTVTLRAVRTSTGYWTLRGLAIGRPLYILHDTIESGSAVLFTISGALGGTGAYHEFPRWYQIGVTTGTNCFITIPTSTTVQLYINLMTGGGVLAYQ